MCSAIFCILVEQNTDFVWRVDGAVRSMSVQGSVSFFFAAVSGLEKLLDGAEEKELHTWKPFFCRRCLSLSPS